MPDKTAPAPPPAAPALAVEDVTFGYSPRQPVVEGVSGTVVGGRVTALLGPNAAGKSTLLRLMLGHLTPQTGRVTLGGESVLTMPARARARRMSYVPQQGGVGFAYAVREVVAMGRFAAGNAARTDAEAVEQAMRDGGLLEVADRVFNELSGGQRQRVLVARAMAQAAGGGQAILLDEPTSSLDLRHVHELMALLRHQADQGRAVVVVLHDLNLAARYADDVWLMDRGRLVAAGGWWDVMRAETLAPVYGVTLRPLDAGSERPVFVAAAAGDTLRVHVATPIR